jgi:hypothetical protein
MRWSKSLMAAAALLMVGAALPRVAQGAEDDTQQWTSASFTHALDDKVSLSFSSRVRFDEDISRKKDLLLGPGMSYALSPALSLGGGYTHLHAFPSGSSSENRAWQQVGFVEKLWGASVGNRLRLEERFVEDVGGAIIRARYRLRLDMPLGGSPWALVGSEEVFVNLNSQGEGPVGGFEQNRLYGGLGFRVTEQLRLEGGYQWEYKENRGSESENVHAILVGFSYRTSSER